MVENHPATKKTSDWKLQPTITQIPPRNISQRYYSSNTLSAMIAVLICRCSRYPLTNLMSTCQISCSFGPGSDLARWVVSIYRSKNRHQVQQGFRLTKCSGRTTSLKPIQLQMVSAIKAQSKANGRLPRDRDSTDQL